MNKKIEKSDEILKNTCIIGKNRLKYVNGRENIPYTI